MYLICLYIKPYVNLHNGTRFENGRAVLYWWKTTPEKKWGTQQRVGFTLMMIGGIGIAISIIAQIYFAARKRASRWMHSVCVCVIWRCCYKYHVNHSEINAMEDLTFYRNYG